MAAPSNEPFSLDTYINHHVSNSTEWHIPFLPTIHLPEFLTLHGLMLIIAACFLSLIFVKVYKRDQRVPKGITNFLEVLIKFIRDDISIKFLGEDDGRKMAPLFCTFFFFILTLNLMGLIPLFSTATANIGVTAGLAIITFFFMVFGCIYARGWKGFLQAIIIPGVPKITLFILVPLEIFGLFIKTFALTIRLFANLLAGHIVIYSLLGLTVVAGYQMLPASIGLALFINILEILVAFLQAYIFTLLSAMFIGQMYHPHH